MKSIKKSTLLEHARLTREFVETGNASLLHVRIDVARELSKQAYGKDNAWLSFNDYMFSVVGVHGLYPECSDRELCSFFQLLGFKVINEFETTNGDKEN